MVLWGLLVAVVSACAQHEPAAGAGKAASAANTAPPGAAPPGRTPRGGAPPAAAPGDPGAGPRTALSGDGVHIEYHVYGHGEPAVMLVHGWACNEDYWREQIEPLASRYTVITLNLAGHGASGRNRTDWSVANYAQDVAAVARVIPNPQLVLVGHSMGADVALAATPLIGARVIGVIAVDALRSVGEAPLAARDIERRIAPFSADFIGQTRSLVTDSLFEKGADPVLAQKVAYDMSRVSPAVAVPSMRSLLSMDLTTLLPAIRAPVFAINSDLAPTDAARIRKALPDFHLDVLDHTGHFLMLEAPARFNPLLLADIAALAQGTPH